jgi:type IV secretion system protein VirB4
LIEQNDEDHQTLVNYAQTFFITSESLEELNKSVFEVEKICRLYGITPVREGWVAQASWFSQFPTYDKYPRMYKMLSRAVATSFNFERQPEGLSKCDWGEGAIALFPTYQGTAYQFEFHVSEEPSAVAHTVAIGPTGQGKTTLYSFLAGQSLRFEDLKVFFFDRYRGAEIFTYAAGGSYINFEGDTKDKDIKKGGQTAFLNPFRIEDNPENRAFLRRWLKEITLVDDANSEAEIARAVTTAFDYLEPSKRTLKNLYKSCFSPAGKMRRELFRWVDDSQYGLLFNSESDSLDLSNRFNTFDFTYIFEDETLAPAVVSYIMNRIQNITGRTGAPSLIIIDETAPMLANPVFRKNFVIGLQEGRKKRQAYLAAFQQPNVLDKLGIGEVIRGQCQTQIFFRNVQARAEDYASWNLTPKEMAFIQGKIYKDLKYAILFRKPTIDESVILNIDLSGLGPYIQLFNSGRKAVLLAEELRNIHGNKFVEVYLDNFK